MENEKKMVKIRWHAADGWYGPAVAETEVLRETATLLITSVGKFRKSNGLKVGWKRGHWTDYQPRIESEK